LKLLCRANWLKWLHHVSMFPFCLSTPDRYGHIPDRHIPLPISRNIEFVFPSGCSRPVPGKQKQEQEWFGCFRDRSRPLSSLVTRKRTVWVFSRPYSRFPYLSRKFPGGIPVLVECQHYFQPTTECSPPKPPWLPLHPPAHHHHAHAAATCNKNSHPPPPKPGK
jgi:hypothetical protein